MKNSTASSPSAELKFQKPRRILAVRSGIKSSHGHNAEHFIWQFQANKPEMVQKYLARNASPDGQIAISTDRARSLFREYGISREGAANYTLATNQAASSIASAVLAAVLESGELRSQETVLVVGGPGVGKTSAQAAYPADAPKVKLWYEGNLSDPDLLQKRVQAVHDAGGRVTVVYVYAPAKLSLERQIRRALEIGRYVPIPYSARVIAHTPASIYSLYQEMGDVVGYVAVDNSGPLGQATFAIGIEAIARLAESRSEDEIKDEQLEHAKTLYSAGQLDDQLYERLTESVPGEAREGNDPEHC
jgi:hypothetical protein